MADDVQPAPESPPPAPEASTDPAAPEPEPEAAASETATESAADPVPSVNVENTPQVPPAAEPAASEPVSDAAPQPSPTPPQAVEPEPEPETSSPLATQVPDSQPVNQTNSNTAPGAHKLNQDERKRGNSKRLQNREQALEKIIEFARTKANENRSITNDTVEKLLHVSNATAHRYLNMLVVRGKLWREGKGRGVRYRVV